MRHRRRIAALLLFGGLVLMMMAAIAAPAGAEVIQGPCVGFADFSNGTSVTESTPISVVNKVPLEDEVVYGGDTTLEPPEEEESFSGNVTVRLPLQQDWTVVRWPDPPDAKTKEVAAAGTYAYEVPSWVPKGTGGLEVTAYHSQRGQECAVAVTMTVDGSPGPAAIIGATGTAVFAAGVIGSGFKRKFS